MPAPPPSNTAPITVAPPSGQSLGQSSGHIPFDQRRPVRIRKVFYIPGYDPFPARRYRELYRSEGRKQAAISGYDLHVTAETRSGGYTWRTTCRMNGTETHTDFEVLTWSDIVQDSMAGSIPATYVQMIRTVWLYLASGTLPRLARLRRGPLIAAVYPVAALILQLALAALLAHLVACGLSDGAGTLSGTYLDPNLRSDAALPVLYAVSFLITLACTLRLLKAQDHRLYAYYLMQDYAFSAGHGGATPPSLRPRLADFADRLTAALTQEYDEVLVVGHSSGAHLAVTILADVIRRRPTETARPALSFLSLGHVIPMVSFLPGAWALRRDLQVLSESRDLVWVDVTAPGDGCCFALCDPVGVSGVSTAHSRWPLVLSAQFSRSIAPERWTRVRRRYLRLHFQYLCAFETPLGYEYFRITAGPDSLGRQFQFRATSPSQQRAPASKHICVAP